MTQIVPSVSVSYAGNGSSSKPNELGMRPMQERAYEKRGEQYLLIKSPPASGKSRALMFIALDKLHNQGLKKAIIAVPEQSIGASFADERLSKHGFWADWTVVPKWNLCNAPGTSKGKVDAVKAFLNSEDRVLICTHATLRFAVNDCKPEAFDECLIAIDEFHHVSVNEESILGEQLRAFINRGKVHIVAMTGTYFRGDGDAVLAAMDESRFETVTYTYYEQLNGYEYLKNLDIGYFFYAGSYMEDLAKVLDPEKKTIIHVPNINSRENNYGNDKKKIVEDICDILGRWEDTDPETGFYLIKTPAGRVLKVADLVDDELPARRAKVLVTLKDPAQKHNREHVDVIIALGMAKEGFDWIWCEHALTIGYRSSLTEIVQIIGRATRDAPGKLRARFTNLIAEPDASEEKVTETVNDMLKAIALSLLMEQVLAPRYDLKPKLAESGPTPGFDYGEGGYDPSKCNVGVNPQTGRTEVEVKGLVPPKSPEAQRICREDLTEVIATFIQDDRNLERGLFDRELVPEELTQQRLGKIIREKYPELDDEDQESIRQHAIASLTITQKAKEAVGENKNMAFIKGVRRFVNVQDFDVDLIDRINPFGEAYAILSKAMNAESLSQIQAKVEDKKSPISPDDAEDWFRRARQFRRERGRFPSLASTDPFEQLMARGAAAYVRFRDEGRYE